MFFAFTKHWRTTISIKTILSAIALVAIATVAVPSSASALEGDYTIKSGDSLSKIADDNQTTWQDLHQKNPKVIDPNLIYAGDTLAVKTAATTTPAPTQPVVTGPPVEKPAQPQVAPVCGENEWVRADGGGCVAKPEERAAPRVIQDVTPVTTYGGNTYTAGQCTWHVKNLKGNLPNGLGNADEWYYNAQAMGLATGTEPVVGAAGVRKPGTGVHAVYVTGVNGDGTITVSEMNYDYTPYNVRTSVKNASEFYYIY